MKKLILAGLAALPAYLLAQQPVILDAPGPVAPRIIKTDSKVVPANQSAIVKINSPLHIPQGNKRAAPFGTVIGHTFYDLQSNSGDQQRIVLRSNGHLAVTWTGSRDDALNPEDRGTFYQYFNGTTWLPEPIVRIEHERTGWPSNVVLNNKEFIVCHNPAAQQYALYTMTRNSIGTGAWDEVQTAIKGLWPRATSNGTSDTVHVVHANMDNIGGNQVGNAYTLYSRSRDGGVNWDFTSRRVTEIDTASGYNIMGVDGYAIVARGDRVAFVSAHYFNDLAVWISDDRGDTFTRYRIIDFPVDNYDGTGILDVDGDNIADTVTTNDEAHAIIIDGNNKVHVWSGRMRVLDDDPGQSAGGGELWGYFPGTNGLYYWNEDFGEDSVAVITGAFDLDGTGLLDDLGTFLPSYQVSLSGMPSAAVDVNTGRVFLVYSAIVEGSYESSDFACYRDLYGMYTDDGETWSDPVNLTNSAHLYNENVFPTVANDANGKVHVVWERDEVPGGAYRNYFRVTGTGGNMDALPPNDHEIVYHAFSYDDFEALPPICGFTFEPLYGSIFDFYTTSTRAGTWLWNFGTGAQSNDQNVRYSFPANGSYNVCLTVQNPYGSDQCCQTVLVTHFGIGSIDQGQIHIYPNPTSGPLTVAFREVTFTRAEVEMYDIVGRQVMQQTVRGISGNSVITVETAGLQSGTYTLRVTAPGGVITKHVEVIN